MSPTPVCMFLHCQCVSCVTLSVTAAERKKFSATGGIGELSFHHFLLLFHLFNLFPNCFFLSLLYSMAAASSPKEMRLIGVAASVQEKNKMQMVALLDIEATRPCISAHWSSSPLRGDFMAASTIPTSSWRLLGSWARPEANAARASAWRPRYCRATP